MTSRGKQIFTMPLKTFKPDSLLEEMLQAKDGDVFVLGEKSIAQQIGDHRVELTIAQIKKVADPPLNNGKDIGQTDAR